MFGSFHLACCGCARLYFRLLFLEEFGKLHALVVRHRDVGTVVLVHRFLARSRTPWSDVGTVLEAWQYIRPRFATPYWFVAERISDSSDFRSTPKFGHQPPKPCNPQPDCNPRLFYDWITMPKQNRHTFEALPGVYLFPSKKWPCSPNIKWWFSMFPVPQNCRFPLFLGLCSRVPLKKIVLVPLFPKNPGKASLLERFLSFNIFFLWRWQPWMSSPCVYPTHFVTL